MRKTINHMSFSMVKICMDLAINVKWIKYGFSFWERTYNLNIFFFQACSFYIHLREMIIRRKE